MSANGVDPAVDTVSVGGAALKKAFAIFAVVVVAVAVQGCSSPSEDTGSSGLTIDRRTQRIESTPPSTFVDDHGHTWVGHEVTSFATGTYPEQPQSTTTPKPPLTLEQAADRFRGRALRVGADGKAWEFIDTTVDIERVKTLLAKNAAGTRMRVGPGPNGTKVVQELPAQPSFAFGASSVTSPYGPSWPRSTRSIEQDRVTDSLFIRETDGPNQVAVSAPEYGGFSFFRRNANLKRGIEVGSLETPQIVVGTDQRVWQSSATGWQAKTTISLTGYPFPTNDGRCSAQLIGTTTAVSSAHCFWPPTATAWKPTRAWPVGVIRWSNGAGPVQQTTQYGPVFGCYWVTIPMGWANPQFNDEDDYAVIDFDNSRTGCSISPPGGSPGTSHTWSAVGNPSDYQNNGSQMHAYDGGSPQPPPPAFGYYDPPSVISRGASFWSVVYDYSTGLLLYHTLDTAGGASGGGILQSLSWSSSGDPTLYFVGPHKGEDGGGGNLARRLDWVMWGHVQNWSTEY